MDPVADPFVRVVGTAAARSVSIAHLTRCRIGRGQHNDIVLQDDAASREHATIQRDGDGACVLIDAGSRNGTLVNGRPVTAPVRLSDGDTIAIGQTQLHFSDPRALLVIAAQPGASSPSSSSDATIFVPQQSFVTVLVIDVRGFTPLSRTIGAERLSAVMTTVFREAGRLLASAGCWSEKFIGDAVMAIWKHAGEGMRSADLVIALDTVILLERLFEGMQARFDLPQPLAFGAAINAGPASLGNMGSGSTADFTALGDTVNKTFRLEAATRQLGSDLVLGEAVVAAVSPPIPPHLLPPAIPAMLKGYDSPQTVRSFAFADIRDIVAGLAG